MLLRPIRAQLWDLRNADEAIIAYENTLKEHAARITQVESAKALNQDVQAAEAELAKITDALAAGKTWLELNAERDQLEDQPATGKDADKARLERISQINRFINHMIDSQYYEKLAAGAVKAGYEQDIAKLKGKADADSAEKLARFEGLLKEIAQEETLLAPAFRTGQRIVKLREQLAVLLQKEYDQLEASASINPGSQTLLETLKRQIEAVKPASLDEARAAQVQAELDALGKEGRGRSKAELQQELKVLRNAVNAWTTYELVKSAVTVPLAELKLDDETLRAKLEEKKTQLGQQIAAEEAKETDYQARLMEVLHHVADARYKYAKTQSSNVEKEKALRTAEREATGLTQRIPRADISNEWWAKFNATYKAIREDLQPFIKQGETLDPAQEIPVPPQVVAGLTWLERPSNVAVTSLDPTTGTAAAKGEKAAEGSESGGGMTWIIVSVLLVLGLAGGAIYMIMGPQKKKKPARAAVAAEASPFDGSGDPFAFPGEGLDEPAPKQPAQPRPVKRTAAAAQRPAEAAPKPRSPGATSADAPRKAAPKKRPPEAAGDAPKPKPKPRPPE
jgi:flagellar basal body-associated protein FliL